MRLAAYFLFAFSLATAAVAAPNELNQEQIHEGWISLFDGKTLCGWHATNEVDLPNYQSDRALQPTPC